MLKLRKLEQRIVLDAAGVVEVVEQEAQHLAAQVGIGAEELLNGVAAFMLADNNAPTRQSFDVVLISNALDDYGQLVNSVQDGAHIVVYDAGQDSSGDILAKVNELAKAEGREVDSLTLLSHGAAGHFMLGKDAVDHEFLEKHKRAFASLNDVMSNDADWFIYSCDVLDQSSNGKQLLGQLADVTGASVFASDDLTGNGGDWVLEGFSGDSFAEQARNGVLDIASLEQNYSGTLEIQVNGSSESANVSITINEGSFLELSDEDHLSATSDRSEVAPEDIVYTVSREPEHGRVILMSLTGDGGVREVGDTFTQYDIDTGRVFYQHDGDPGTVGDSVRFTITDGYPNSSNEAEISITVIDTNDKPVVDFNVTDGREGLSTGTQVEFTEGDEPVVLATGDGVVITDEEGHRIQSASAYFQGYFNNIETLQVDVGDTGLLWEYDSATGLLLIQGVADASVYEDVLATLSYHSVVDGHGEDDSWERVVRITVTDNDQDNPRTSERVSALINIIPVNDAPVLDTDNSSGTYETNFSEDQGAVAVFAPQFTLYDVDNQNLTQAQVAIENTPDGDFEYLTVDVSVVDADLDFQYNSVTGILQIAGTATVEEYQAVLATVCYHNDSNSPNEDQRTINVRVRDSETFSDVSQTLINVESVNDVPTIEITAQGDNDNIEETFTEGDEPVAILVDRLELADVDHNVFTSAVIEISNRPNGEAEQYRLDVGDTGLTVVYEESRITLSGSAPIADYEAVLETLTYQNLSEDPSAEDRLLTIAVTDGEDVSNSVEATVHVIPVDDDSEIDATVNGEIFRNQYIENEAAVSVVPNDATLSDVDSATIDGLRVTISNLQNGADENLLATVVPFGIEADYANGVLVLSGTETTDAYEQVLRGIRYSVDGDQPTAGDRVIEIEVLNNGEYTDPVTTVVEVVPVNDAPIINTDLDASDDNQVGYRVTFEEGQGPVAVVDQDAVIEDIDSDTLNSLVVTIQNAEDGSLEVLTADVAGTGLTAFYDQESATLTINGSASEAIYAQVLASVRYDNSSDNPSSAERTLAFQTSDGDSLSNISYTTVSVVGNNDPAVIGHDPNDPGQVFEVTFTEDQGPVAVVSQDFFVTDVDSEVIAGATITLINLPDGAEETLSLDYQGQQFEIARGNGVLVITGDGSAEEYADLIRRVQYENVSQNPNLADRQVEVVVNDGSSNSNAINSVVHVAPVNDAPVVINDPTDENGDGNDHYQAEFVEGDAPVLVVDPETTIEDIDNDVLVSARVEIVEMFDLGEESLAAVGTDNIEVFFDEDLGILRLQGEASIAEYQQVLRTLTYQNASEEPSEDDRHITIRVFDGQAESEIVDTTITVRAENDAPEIIVTPVDGNENIREEFVEGDEPLAVLAERLDFVDVDDNEIVSAVVSIINRPDGADELYTIDTGDTGIQAAVYEDRIELTGNASLEAYETVLETLTYQNVSEAPSDEDRLLDITLSDGESDSDPLRAVIEVTPVDDEAVLAADVAGEAYRDEFVENADPVAVLPATLSITDPDSDQIDGLRIAITNIQDGGEELIVESLPGDLFASFDAGVLTISGTASLEVYETVLASIAYVNNGEDPTAGQRDISTQLLQNGVYGSAVQSYIDVTPVNDAPVIDTDPDSVDGNEIGYQVSYTEGDDPVSVMDSDFIISDVDSDQLTGVVVTITNAKDGDELAVITDGTGISADYDPDIGELLLTGDATVEEYQAVLATLTYANISDDPSTDARQIELQTSDGQSTSNVTYTTVSVTAVNDATLIGHDQQQPGSAYQVTFTEDQAAVNVVADTFFVADPDSQQLASATILLANTPDGADEALSLDYTGDQFDIAYADGVLTIAGSGTAEEYQTLIREVTYSNASQDPDTADRLLSITLNDGDGDSNVVESTIQVSAVNDAPDVQIDPDNNSGDGPRNFRGIWVEDGGPASVVDTALQVIDVDNDTLQGARIALDDFPDQGAETLAVTTVGDIQAEYRAEVGILVLSGEGTLAEYEQVLRSLTYDNASQSPTDDERVVTISVFDGQDYSTISQSTIEIVDEKDDPNVDLDGQGLGTDYEATFVEDGGPVAAANDVRITDVDSVNLSAATIQLINIQEDGQEFISVTVPDAYPQLAVNYDPATGILTITGDASTTAYEEVLSTLTYENTSNDPTETDRFVTVTVTDSVDEGEQMVSAVATTTIHIEAINDNPIIVPPEEPLVVNPGQEVAVLPSFLNTEDPDSPPEEVIYTITTPSTAGNILLDGQPLGEGDSFTQEDINNGDVSFVADESPGTNEDEMELNVSNPGDDKSGGGFVIGINIPGVTADGSTSSDPSDRLFQHAEYGPFTSSTYPDLDSNGIGHSTASAAIRDLTPDVVGDQLADIQVNATDLEADDSGRYNDAIERIQQQATQLQRSLEMLESESSLDLPQGTAGVFAADGVNGDRDLVQTCSELGVLDDGCRIVPSDDWNQRIETAQSEQVGLTDSGSLATNDNSTANFDALGGDVLDDADNCETLAEAPKVFATDFGSQSVAAECDEGAAAPVVTSEPVADETTNAPLPKEEELLLNSLPSDESKHSAEQGGGQIRQLVDKVLNRIR